MIATNNRIKVDIQWLQFRGIESSIFIDRSMERATQMRTNLIDMMILKKRYLILSTCMQLDIQQIKGL